MKNIERMNEEDWDELGADSNRIEKIGRKTPRNPEPLAPKTTTRKEIPNIVDFSELPDEEKEPKQLRAEADEILARDGVTQVWKEKMALIKRKEEGAEEESKAA